MVPIEARQALILVKDPLLRSVVARMSYDVGLSVREARTIEEADLMGTRHSPDLIIAELVPEPGKTALDVVAELRKLHNRRIPAVILTSHRSPYLVQDDPPSLRDCSYIVRSDMDSAVIIRAAIERAIRGDTGIHHNNVMGLPKITRNQAAVLRLVASGLSNEQIAKSRNKSGRAVELTITRLYSALGVDRRAAVNSRVAASLLYHQSKVTVR